MIKLLSSFRGASTSVSCLCCVTGRDWNYDFVIKALLGQWVGCFLLNFSFKEFTVVDLVSRHCTAEKGLIVSKWELHIAMKDHLRDHKSQGGGDPSTGVTRQLTRERWCHLWCCLPEIIGRHTRFWRSPEFYHLLFYTRPLPAVRETQPRIPAISRTWLWWHTARCQTSPEVLDAWPIAIWELASDFHPSGEYQGKTSQTGSSCNSLMPVLERRTSLWLFYRFCKIFTVPEVKET